MKPLLALIGLGGVAVLASSCDLLGGGSSAPPSQPVIVTNNIPSGADSGTTILLTVAGISAFILLGVAIVMGMLWFSERRRRTAAEDAVVALTGRPMSQLALMVAAPMSTERLQALAVPFPASEPHKALR